MHLNDEYSYANKNKLASTTVAEFQDPLIQQSADAFTVTAAGTQGNGTETMSVNQFRDQIAIGASSLNNLNSPLLPKATQSNISSNYSYKQTRQQRLRNSYNKVYNTGSTNATNFSLMQAKLIIQDGQSINKYVSNPKKIRKQNKTSHETVSQLFANSKKK